jgi:hypothetical protein
VGGLTDQLREFVDAHREGVLATASEDVVVTIACIRAS